MNWIVSGFNHCEPSCYEYPHTNLWTHFHFPRKYPRILLLGHVKHACVALRNHSCFPECPCTSLSLWPHVSSNSVWGDCIFYESLLCSPWSSLASPVPVCCQLLEILSLRFMSEGRSKVKVLSVKSQALFKRQCMKDLRNLSPWISPVFSTTVHTCTSTCLDPPAFQAKVALE